MTDNPAPPQPADAQQAAPLHNYRIRLLNGETFDVGSPYEWPVFWSVVRRDGYLIASAGYLPHHAIASIVPLESTTPPAQVIKLVHDASKQT